MAVPTGSVISTILKHDNKVTSYKIALLRAINDVVLSFPVNPEFDVAIPLERLAESWLAYYFPFAGEKPIRQGQKIAAKNDISFRPHLTRLRAEWETIVGPGRPADGYFLVNEMRIARKRLTYPLSLLKAYKTCVQAIARAIEMPICYAGPGKWTVFDKPAKPGELSAEVTVIPGVRLNEVCLIVKKELWGLFIELSLWVEALCIHEWCLFTENATRNDELPVDRGLVYDLLTSRPDNRRPLTWERNQIDILMMEGADLRCPWTGRHLGPGDYAIDHIIPVSIVPINELWNLAPADSHVNSHIKRDLLPSVERFASAEPFLTNTYRIYDAAATLHGPLRADVGSRFANARKLQGDFPLFVSEAAGQFIEHVGSSRNLSRF